MLIYAESSAVLSWLVGEPEGADVVSCLRDAEAVLSSELTVTECARALVRLQATGLLGSADALSRRALLHRATRSWSMLELNPAVFERARRPFPLEPVRTLDALHLALVACVAEEQPALRVLTRDHRIRENAAALGVDVLP